MRKAIFAIAILVLAAAPAFAEKEFTFDKDNNFDGAAVKAVQIDIPTGEITIVKSQGDNIEVRYKNTIMADDQAEADDINRDLEYKAELSGDRLVISIEEPRRRGHRKGIINRIIEGNWNDDIYPALKISLPDGKVVDISSASADVDVSNLKLDLDIESASTDVMLENTQGSFSCEVSSGDISITGHKGDVSVKGVSSDLRFTDIEGRVSAATASGDVSGEKIKGPVQASSASGDHHLYDIEGDLDVNTASGDIEVESAGGSVRAKSISGDLRLGALSAPEGIFDVESVSGQITMEVSSNFKGEIAVRSVSGSVTSELSGKVVYDDDSRSSSHSRLRGTVGDGGKGRLSVATTSGDISINGY